MSEQNNVNIFVQIEQEIKNTLNGDNQKTALDLLAYLKDSGFKTEGGFPPHFTYKGNWSCVFVYFKDENHPSGHWFVCCLPGEIDVSVCSDFSIDESVKEFAQANVKICDSCYGECFALGGKRRTIFGKEYDGVCCNIFHFHAPNSNELEKVKKLMDLQKYIINDTQCTK
ncbi:MAG: hypothetical protein FWE06_09360 [Oscillospiraceae bacterium]|nr:hypothetical protein [Oscillospiraceae bacterium]